MGLSKTEQLIDLYKQYHFDKKYIRGGMAKEDGYNTSKYRILTLLKEANNQKDIYEWHLPDLLLNIYERKTCFFRIWKNISRWALVAEQENLCFQDIAANEELLYNGIGLFATTNLKKTAGTGSSNYDEISEHAKNNYDEWYEEIKILDPKLIICGGTYNIVKDILDKNLKIECGQCKTSADYFTCEGRVYLEFYHPACRFSDAMLFSHFKETMGELREVLNKF